MILRAKLRDTQALKYNEGCTYKGLLVISTQTIGERLDADLRTSACFIDLQEAFDTVQRRFLFGRLRSFGICGKLLRALQAGYGKRALVGKLGQKKSRSRRDIGLGTQQGEVDSSDAFARFIDDLDAEIEHHEEKLGRRIGIPRVGVCDTSDGAIPTLKHADDTVLLAAS